MELPHWLMAVGAILLMVGFVGSALRENTIVTSEPDSLEGDQAAEAHTKRDNTPNPQSVAAAS
jgi:hypothetical protein